MAPVGAAGVVSGEQTTAVAAGPGRGVSLHGDNAPACFEVGEGPGRPRRCWGQTGSCLTFTRHISHKALRAYSIKRRNYQHVIWELCDGAQSFTQSGRGLPKVTQLLKGRGCTGTQGL